jgi:branched-chain amino acid transport system ATP-binding protein
MPLLEVKQLEVVYSKIVTAVRDVSIEVDQGAIVGVVGLNGAGKTTTLRSISGFLPKEDVQIRNGQILFDGMDITGWRPDRLARMGIEMVPERRKIFETLTVEEHLALRQGQRGNGAARVDLDAVFELFPFLEERRKIRGVYLSGGEQQALALAGALLTSPRLLLIDEASLGLAPILVWETMRSLRTVNEKFGTSLLVVDQNAQALFAIADFGYVMEGGRVVYAGATDRLLKHQDVREFYLGVRQEDARSYREVKQYRRSRRWWG